MKTMVVLDESIVRYLLELVERYGFPDELNTTTRHQLATALAMLAQARAEQAKKEGME
jgi:hypothetical protein